jgi:hypothetical protein
MVNRAKMLRCLVDGPVGNQIISKDKETLPIGKYVIHFCQKERHHATATYCVDSLKQFVE